MLLLRDKAISHLRRYYTHTKILPTTTKISNMDSSNNQQKKEGEKQFSIQPINESSNVDPKFAAHQAHPGPAISQQMPPQQGTKEERQARKEELNK
ncbi:hypothetical protein V8C40DRAFT_239124 [Trichoderma camerunense]|uniref:Uncharacterized protein n=1 Tax=Trichoderma lentiforme TaxID=1567552 RepID=A0A9P4XD84_9HYPO|nr:hypothetical protein CFAM422_007791 [Trichoderma lentiforme]